MSEDKEIEISMTMELGDALHCAKDLAKVINLTVGDIDLNRDGAIEEKIRAESLTFLLADLLIAICDGYEDMLAQNRANQQGHTKGIQIEYAQPPATKGK